jgi:hypothetical protein
MIERHYGALLDGAHSVIASRLDAFEATLVEQAATGETRFDRPLDRATQ